MEASASASARSHSAVHTTWPAVMTVCPGLSLSHFSFLAPVAHACVWWVCAHLRLWRTVAQAHTLQGERTPTFAVLQRTKQVLLRGRKHGSLHAVQPLLWPALCHHGCRQRQVLAVRTPDAHALAGLAPVSAGREHVQALDACEGGGSRVPRCRSSHAHIECVCACALLRHTCCHAHPFRPNPPSKHFLRCGCTFCASRAWPRISSKSLDERK